MNNRRRAALKGAVRYLDLALNIAETALDEEQDCVDNMPENLYGSDRYEKMEAAVDYLTEVVSLIEGATEAIREVVA